MRAPETWTAIVAVLEKAGLRWPDGDVVDQQTADPARTLLPADLDRAVRHCWIVAGGEDPDDRPFPRFEDVDAKMKAWVEAGAQLWDLPADAVHLVLAGYGAESNPDGTADALEALTEECDACSGEAIFYGDSPSAATEACEVCRGFGRVPLRAAPTKWREGFEPSGGVDHGA